LSFTGELGVHPCDPGKRWRTAVEVCSEWKAFGNLAGVWPVGFSPCLPLRKAAP